MGRYLRGTAGFSYKYAFAEQDENLGELVSASEAGGGGLRPSFGGGYVDREENFEVAIVPLLRAIKSEGKAKGGEINGVVPPHTDALASGTLEFVQYALGENLIEVVLRLDRALDSLPFGVMLEGYSTYELERDDYPRLAAYVDRYRQTKLDLAELRDEKRAEAIALELGSADNYMPAMALWILQHAVAHDLPAISVYETQPSRYAEDFWRLVNEWGPSIFYSPPATATEWFVRGLCETFRGDRDAGQQSLARAASGGFEPAKRWLDAATEAEPAAIKQPSKKPAAKNQPSKKAAAKKQSSPKPAKPAAKKSSKKPAKTSLKKSATKSSKKPATKSPKKPATTSAKKPATKKPAKKSPKRR